MAHFLSGPPGGRTLPLTHTALSDLEGGVYGPGSSVASTGYQAHRYTTMCVRVELVSSLPRHVIRASQARAAGETWADVLDYYQVTIGPYFTEALPAYYTN